MHLPHFSRRPFALLMLVLLSTLAGVGIAHGAPSALDQVVDGNLVFLGPGQNGLRDIRTSDNLGGLRFYNGSSLTNPPQGASI